jgi:hypothetical protein
MVIRKKRKEKDAMGGGLAFLETTWVFLLLIFLFSHAYNAIYLRMSSCVYHPGSYFYTNYHIIMF